MTIQSENHLYRTARFARTASPILLACAAMLGCGGGGTDSSIPEPSNGGTLLVGLVVKGKVIDGYIAGANVCLDVNRNQTCDSGEPATVSDADGIYSLDAAAFTAAQVASSFVLVSVPTTAKDADDGGKTLAEAGKKAFNLLAPVSDAASNMVTPLTTLVAQQMLVNGVTEAQAAVTVRNQLGLGTSGSLNVDYTVDANQAAAATVAKVAAVALGEINAAITAGAPAGTAESTRIIATLNELSSSLGVLRLSLGLEANPTFSATVAQIQQALKATTDALAANSSSAVQTAAGVQSSTVASLEALLAAGMGDIESFLSTLTVHLTKGSNGTWTGLQAKSTTAPRFAAPTADDADGYLLGGSGWIARTPGGTYTAQADGSYLVTGDSFGNAGALMRSRQEDLGGKTFASVGQTGTGTFPAGATAVWFSMTRAAAAYGLSSETQGQSGSLAEMTTLPRTPTSGAALTFKMNHNGTSFTFDGPLTASGTITYWPFSNTSTASIGQGSYELRTLNGAQILVMTQVPIAALNGAAAATGSGGDQYKSDYAQGQRLIFSVAPDGIVHRGWYMPAGTFSDLNPSFNLPGLNALLNARGYCGVNLAGNNVNCP